MFNVFLGDKSIALKDKYLQEAQLPYVSVTLSDIDLRQHPSLSIPKLEVITKGGWLENHSSVLLYGNGGEEQVRLGCYIAKQIVNLQNELRCYSMFDLILMLKKSKSKQTLKKEITSLGKLDVLFIYDWFVAGLSVDHTYLLSQLLDARKDKGGFIISTSTPIKLWSKQSDDIGFIERIDDILASNYLFLEFDDLGKEGRYVH